MKQNKNNCLKNLRFYLAGPIDRCPNLGIEWRLRISNELNKRYNAISYNPMAKPIEIAGEIDGRILRRQWKSTGQYDQLAKFMKTIRRVDLRMTDKADVGIFYIDTNIHMCGSYEELTWMNRCKKPCLIMCEQGKCEVPDWIFGMIPHCHIFSSWGELFSYLDSINLGYNDNTNRWMIFSY